MLDIDGMRMKLPPLLIAILIITLLFGAEPANPCSCEGLPRTADELIQLIEQSDIVFLGQLDEAHIRLWAADGEQKKEFYVKYSVIEWFKGRNREPEIEIEFEMERLDCGPSPIPKNTFLVFASKNEDGHRAKAHPCRKYLYEYGNHENAWENEALKDSLAPILDLIRSTVW